MTMTSYNVLIFIKEIWTMSCICKYFQTIVNVFFIIIIIFLSFFLYYQHRFELPCTNVCKCICCMLHIFLTHVFLGTMVWIFPNASSPQNFEVSIIPMQPKDEAQPRPFKLICFFVDGLLCGCSSLKVR